MDGFKPYGWRVVDFVSGRFEISPARVRGHERSRDVVLCRRACCWVMFSTSPMSMAQIAKPVGLADHTTVSAAIAHIERRMKANEDFAELMLAIKTEMSTVADRLFSDSRRQYGPWSREELEAALFLSKRRDMSNAEIGWILGREPREVGIKLHRIKGILTEYGASTIAFLPPDERDEEIAMLYGGRSYAGEARVR